jgi:hypothetical protein
MLFRILAFLILIVTAEAALICNTGLTASPDTALVRAKKDAEAKGYIFVSSHDDIVAKAKAEGKMRGLSSLDSRTLKPMTEAFKNRYPFIDTYVEEISGTDAGQRFLMEVKSGTAKDWDILRAVLDFYNDYVPYGKKFDLLGMAQHGILQIPIPMIDPEKRNIVALGSRIHVVAYNRTLIADDKVPGSWEDFLKPEFKGRKFVMDIRPQDIPALVATWGFEKAITFAKAIAAQEPVWGNGTTRMLAALAAGEYALFMGPSFTSVKRLQEKDQMGILRYKFVEPLPTRLTKPEGVLNIAKHPYSALLWVEFQASLEGQAIMDKYEPYGASLFSSGSVSEKESRGKKLSVLDWEHLHKYPQYQKMVAEASGFPRAEIGQKK